MKYSVIIPVYNGEGTIQTLFNDLSSFFNSTKLDFEVIFVYDDGIDNSWPIILKLKETNPKTVKAVKLTRNYGQHNAIICGFEYATGDFIVTMDEDLQHNPIDIELLINKQKEGDFDLVYGKYNELNHNWFRNFTSVLIRKILSKAIEGLSPNYSAFRLIKKDIAKKTTNMMNSYTFLDGYVSWITKNVSYTTVSHNERLAGDSGYTVKKLLVHFMNILFTFSSLPIKLLSTLSILIFILTVIYSCYLISLKILYNNLIDGFPTMVIIMCFGISVILLGLSIIGEYLFRINLKTTRRPNYIVEKAYD